MVESMFEFRRMPICIKLWYMTVAMERLLVGTLKQKCQRIGPLWQDGL
jgi:hypothetical protein